MPTTQTPYHVTPYGAYWAVRRADEGAPLKQTVTQQAAISYGRRLALADGVPLVLLDHRGEVKHQLIDLDDGAPVQRESHRALRGR